MQIKKQFQVASYRLQGKRAPLKLETWNMKPGTWNLHLPFYA